VQSDKGSSVPSYMLHKLQGTPRSPTDRTIVMRRRKFNTLLGGAVRARQPPLTEYCVAVRALLEPPADGSNLFVLIT
jgi:hypothetical protein